MTQEKEKFDILDAIEKRAKRLQRLHFPDLSSNYVPGEGDNPIAMIIGEAPGAQEDIKKRPFIGASGQVLRRLMYTAGLHATALPSSPPNCWLTNVVKFRPPGNRNPTTQEIQAFRALLRIEWRAIGQPGIIIPVGKIALTAVMGHEMSILKVAGKVSHRRASTGQTLHIWPMIHPRYALSNKSAQPALDADWQELASWLHGIDQVI